jgi:MYXO-CTERM domain-containing protein
MKALFPVLLLFFIASPAYAHPGKTGRHGGHQCLKDCADWDLYYREYHTHDKDGRSIRITGKKPVQPAPTEVPAAVEAKAADRPVGSPVPPAAVGIPVAPSEPETSVLPWLLLALFLLLLLAVRRRGRSADG